MNDKKISSRNLACSKRDYLLTMAAQLVDMAESLPDEQPEQLAAATLITQALFCKITGYSSDRLDGMRRRGELVQNEHYVITPKNNIDWDLKAFEQWQRSKQVSTLETGKYESVSSIGVHGSLNRSAHKPALETLRKRQK